MEKFERLHLKIAKCTKCETIIDYKKFPMNSHGNSKSKNMIISEAPPRISVNNGKYWTGDSGALLRECISDADLNLEKDFYVTDVIKCWPHKINSLENRTPNKNEIDNCSRFLSNEIELLNPKHILLFGDIAAKIFIKYKFQMRDIHGKEHELENGTMLFFFYHPSFITSYNRTLELEYRELLTTTLKNIKNKKW